MVVSAPAPSCRLFVVQKHFSCTYLHIKSPFSGNHVNFPEMKRFACGSMNNPSFNSAKGRGSVPVRTTSRHFTESGL